jgi:hypothetical protein
MNLSVSSASVTAGNYTVVFTDRSGSYYREFNVDILNENGSSVRTLTYSAIKYDYLKNGDKIKFTALNTTKARRLAIAQKVMGLPVIAIYEGGAMIDSLVKDDATPENVEAMIKKYI